MNIIIRDCKQSDIATIDYIESMYLSGFEKYSIRKVDFTAFVSVDNLSDLIDFLFNTGALSSFHVTTYSHTYAELACEMYLFDNFSLTSNNLFITYNETE